VAAQQSQNAPPQNPPAQSQPAPSLADAARKARETKKSEPKTAKVFTNDNLPGSAEVNVVGSEAAAPAAENATAPTAKASLAQQEQYWHDRFAKARAKLDRDSAELDVLQREMSRLQLVFYPNDPMKQLQQSVTLGDITGQQHKIEKKQADIAADKAAISDLEDALRHAGGDPGWAR
jgi:chromosome segregation ATPase